MICEAVLELKGWGGQVEPLPRIADPHALHPTTKASKSNIKQPSWPLLRGWWSSHCSHRSSLFSD